ncbi:nucleoside phosphorylase domain-containing protein [Xylaria sp. FL1042]|nr:nucleoside phosphorylase domain-containing protein [Xylaria sp. FL1042]
MVSKPTTGTFTHPETKYAPSRPDTCGDFEIAVICALPLEADAVLALFDSDWDNDDQPYNTLPGDPNAYTTGAMGRHNIVLVHMPEPGKVNAATVASNCRASFPNIKLAILVGICGAVPFDTNGNEIVLGDVIISDSVVEYDLGRQFPDHFIRKNTLADSLPRPSSKIRSTIAKLRTHKLAQKLQNGVAKYLDVLLSQSMLEAQYPGMEYDKLFDANYHHAAEARSCEKAGCITGPLVLRKRLEQTTPPQPSVHIGLIASGDTVMRSGKQRDLIAQKEGALAFEMESAGIWDTFPSVVIKGVCDYADSHKTKLWQRYAAATAAACLKAFLEIWAPSMPSAEFRPELIKQSTDPWYSSRVTMARDASNCEREPQRTQHTTGSRNTRHGDNRPTSRHEITKLRCLRCDLTNHLLKDCYAGDRTVERGRLNRMNSGRCYWCGEEGHWQDDCPKLRGREY